MRLLAAFYHDALYISQRLQCTISGYRFNIRVFLALMIRETLCVQVIFLMKTVNIPILRELNTGVGLTVMGLINLAIAPIARMVGPFTLNRIMTQGFFRLSPVTPMPSRICLSVVLPWNAVTKGYSRIMILKPETAVVLRNVLCAGYHGCCECPPGCLD